jgi:protein involved in polysaccharide export with SLBB domain
MPRFVMNLLVLFCSLLVFAVPASYAAPQQQQLLQQFQQSQGGLQQQEPQLQQLLDLSASPAVSGQQQLTLPTDNEAVIRKDTVIQPKLTLLAEPGDGQIRLKWTLEAYRPKAGEGTIKFIISYGTEANRYIKTIPVGSINSFSLQELRNNQPYFVKVAAVSTALGMVASSKEIMITPLVSNQLISALERSFSQKAKTYQEKVVQQEFKRELKQFGYDFFRNTSQLSSLSENLAVADEYIIGVGDTLNISVWGGINVRYDLTVDRAGDIIIPKVGAVRLSGLSYEQARLAINKSLGQYYRDFDSSVTFGKLRTMQIYLVGELETPGSYPVSSVSSVLNALAAAGGPTKNGSLRRIKVSRNGKTVAEVDLYEILLSGNRVGDVRLQSGDTVFVPVIGPVVAVAGEIRRPAIYELKGSESLTHVLQMAGGLTPVAHTGRVQIERFADNVGRIVIDHELKNGDYKSQLSKVEIRDHDMVKVFPMQEAVRQVVTLKGNVVHPGEYQLRKGMRLRDLIPDYQHLLPDSYGDAVEIIRLVPPDLHRTSLTVSLTKALAGTESDNILLQDQDAIKIFSRWEMQEKPQVSISGSVVNPGVYDFYPGMTVRDLITAAGSAKRNALLESAELGRLIVGDNRAVSERKNFNLGKALQGDPQHNIVLEPDDVVSIRSITNWIDASENYVKLRGEVRYPGVYSIALGERLSSVIERAGGYTDKAYLRAAKFVRKSVKEAQQKRMDEVILKTEKDILGKQSSLSSTASSKEELEATKASLEGLLRSLEKMKTLKAEGRIVLQLSPLAVLKKSDFDITLEGWDELEIPAKPSVINVLGQVYNPTSFVYQENQPELKHYLQLAGGPTSDGDASEMYLIRPDGSVQSRQNNSFGFFWNESGRRWGFSGFTSTELEPGDTIVVPQRIERVAWMRDIKDITQILANVAMTAGSVYLWFK